MKGSAACVQVKWFPKIMKSGTNVSFCSAKDDGNGGGWTNNVNKGCTRVYAILFDATSGPKFTEQPSSQESWPTNVLVYFPVFVAEVHLL